METLETYNRLNWTQYAKVQVSLHGLIAQWGEQTAVNRFVEGSSPSESAMFLLGCSQVVRHQTLNLAFPWFESKCPSHFSECSSAWESS